MVDAEQFEASSANFLCDPEQVGRRDFIFPGALQETTYNFLYFIAQTSGFLQEALDQIQPFDFRHRLIEL